MRSKRSKIMPLLSKS